MRPALLATGLSACLVHGFGVWDAVQWAIGNDDVAQDGGGCAVEGQCGPQSFPVLDASRQDGVPKVRVGHTVQDLLSGDHLDALMRATPEEMRPPAVVLFYDSALCLEKADKLDYLGAIVGRERALLGRYDTFAAPRRPWFQFTPNMDLAGGIKKAHNVRYCSFIAVFPPTCNAWASCVENVKIHKPSDSIAYDEMAVPSLSRVLGTYKEQRRWLSLRDQTTLDDFLNIMYYSQAMPALTETGFLSADLPEDLYNRLIDYYLEHRESGLKIHSWDLDNTRINHWQVSTPKVELDERIQRAAARVLKPMVEDWSGISDLQVAGVQGMFEYQDGVWIRPHVQAGSDYLFSATICLGKANRGKAEEHPWNLAATGWDGRLIEIPLPNRKMVFYESQKLAIGMPVANSGGMHLAVTFHFKSSSIQGADERWTQSQALARAKASQWVARKSKGALEEASAPLPAKEHHIRWATNDLKRGSDSSSPGPGSTPDRKERFTATFMNQANVALDLFWQKSGSTEVVFQAALDPMRKIALQTFSGHHFFFAQKGSQTPITGATFFMNEEQHVYKYSSMLSPNAASWHKLARAAYEKEIHGFDDNEAFVVTFINAAAGRDISIYWLPEDDQEMVLQKTLTPSRLFEVSTYAGHRFCFADVGSTECIFKPYVMSKRHKVIKFLYERDGAVRNASKFHAFARQRYAQELARGGFDAKDL